VTFPDPFSFETRRLRLSALSPADFEAWAACFADSEVMAGLAGSALDRSQAWRSFAVMLGHWQHRGFGMFSVYEKAGGAWVGRVGPWYPEGWPGHEIGWTIARPFWGRGYAAEAALGSMAFARTHLGWKSVCHVIAPTNHNSRRVAEKLGSTLVGTLNRLPGIADPITVDIWAQDLALK
jgi:RimJ/RimL family protein N-acetyltransferase